MKIEPRVGRGGWWAGLVLAAGCAAEVGPEGVDQSAVTPSMPDLTITRLVGPPSTSGAFTAEVTVCNRGQAPAPTSQVNVYVSRDRRIIGLGQVGADPFAGTIQVLDLAPTQCRTVSNSLFVSVPTEGPYYLAANVDEFAAIPESNERNNLFIGGLMGIGFRSDLIVADVTGPVSTQGELRPTVRVCNQGTQPSGPNQVNVYLSADTLLRGIVAYPTSPDPFLGPIPVPSLQPGQCSPVSANFWAPVPTPGGYYLAAFVDEHRSETELNENNNTKIGSLVGVGAGSDLVISAISAPPSTQGPIHVGVRVCNQGTTFSGGQPVNVYLSADPKITGIFEQPTTPDRLVVTLPTPGLDAGRCADLAGDGFAPVPNPGAYYLGAIVDETNAELELIESNNRFTGSLIGVGSNPDLVVDRLTGPASTTGNFDLTVRICNQGTVSAPGTNVTFYLTADATLDSSPTPWADPFLGQANVGPLNAGQCTSITQNVFAPVPGNGAYQLAAVVDPNRVVPELIETNNQRIEGLIGVGQGPDLLIQSLSAPPSTQGPLPIVARVCNQGTTPASSTDLAIYASTDTTLEGINNPWPGDPFAGILNVPNLEPGRCQNVQGELYVPIPLPGAYRLIGQLDPWNNQPELIESNNLYVGPEIGLGSGPDLRVTAIQAPPSAMGNFAATLTVCNQGTSPSGTIDVSLHLSSDTTIEGPQPNGDPLAGMVTAPDLQPGQCAQVSGDFNAFGPPGAFYLGAIVDPFQSQLELIETNNTLVGGLIGVGSGSDLVITSLTAPPSSNGGQIAVTARVCNQGTTYAGPQQVSIYLSRDEELSGLPNLSPDDYFAGLLDTQDLAAGQCRDVTGQVSAFPYNGDGAYRLAARVDENNNELELIESNNQLFGGTIGLGYGPDLVATRITAPATTDGPFTASVELCNQGTAPAWAGDVALYLSADTTIEPGPGQDSDALAGFLHFDTLQPGQCLTRSEPLYASTQGPGEYHLAVIVDPFSGSVELREDNNQLLQGVIGVGSGPDLVITELSGPASSLGNLTVTARVCNQGTAPGSNTDLAVYLSSDRLVEGIQNPWPGDPFAGFLSVPNLAPGECRQVSQELYAPIPNPGAYYLIGVLDPWANVPELIESNNTFVAGLVGLGSGADLYVASFTAPPSAMSTFTGRARVCNQGTIPSGPTPVVVYASADQVIETVQGNPSLSDFVLGELQAPALQAGQCGEISGELSGFAPNGPGTYYLGTQIDPWGSEAELIESNNLSVVGTIGIGPGSDLIVTGLTAPASANGPITATARVCNQGTTAAGPTQVNFYLSRDRILTPLPASEDFFLGGEMAQFLEAGRCADVAAQLYPFAFDGDGTYYLIATVDEWESEPELNERNNVYVGGAIGVGFGPDLTITALTGPASTNGALPVEVRVCNQGTAQAGGGEVEVYLSVDAILDSTPPYGDAFAGVVHHGPLAAGRCAVVSETLFAPVFQQGAQLLLGRVDAYDAQVELREDNNLYVGAAIGVGQGPDLVVTELTGPASSQGELPVNATVCNQGTQPAPGTDLAVYLSADLTLEGIQNPWPGDPFAGFLSVPPLAPGACQSISQQLWAWAPNSGAYYLLAELDPWNNVSELIESNNLVAGERIGFGPGPDLVVTQFSAPASTFGSFNGSVTVCNQGTIPAPGTEVAVYVSADATIERIGQGGISDSVAGFITVPPLAPNACASASGPLYAAVFGPSGVYQLGVVVDEWNAVPELIEDNNLLMAGELGVGPGADLVVESVSTPASTNGPFFATVEVCNQGTTHAGPNQVAIYLSADLELIGINDGAPEADFFVGTITVSDLGPSQCTTVTEQLWAGGAPGLYHVGAIVDEVGLELELNEGNNRGFFGDLLLSF